MEMKRERILALDVFRGLIVAMMIVLDAPPDVIYPILQHSAWEGLTITDLPFPAFIFAMGVSAAISTARRKPSLTKIFRRAGLLFLLGMILNELPYVLAILLQENFTGADFFYWAIEHFRVFGILQRFALVYAFGMILAMFLKSDTGIFAATLMLLCLSSLGFHLYAPDAPFAETRNISSAVDFIIPGANHIYTPTHDPEGLYGVLASTASMLIGFLAGRILVDHVILREKISSMLAIGAVLLLAGSLWASVDIISKKIWTTPYALINAGGDMILLAGLLLLFEKIPRTKKYCESLTALGKNPLFFFVASGVGLIFFSTAQVSGVSFWSWIYQHTIRGLISVEFSTTLFCLIWLAIWLIPAKFLDRRGIIIKL